MTVVYDAGVLVAADRNDRKVWADHRARLEQGAPPTTTAPVVSQVSRSDRQVQLRRFLRGCGVEGLTAVDAHHVGALLAVGGTADVVDAHLVVTAARLGAAALTSDVGDIAPLAGHIRPRVRVLQL
jgi:hypothetical protein